MAAVILAAISTLHICKGAVYIRKRALRVSKLSYIHSIYTDAARMEWRQVYLQKSPTSYTSAKDMHISANEPHRSAKEPCISAKDLHISTKEPYISAKERDVSAKEPHVSA